MSVSQFVLLGYISCRTVEVIPAAADLNSVLGSKSGRGEAIDSVIGEPRKDQVLVVELMIDPGVVGVVVLGLVGADGEVAGEVVTTGASRQWCESAGGRREQRQIVQCDGIDGYRAAGRGNQSGMRLRGAVGGRQERQRARAADAVNVVVLILSERGAGVGGA